MNSPGLPFNTTLLHSTTCPFSSKDLFGSYNYIQSSYCSQPAFNSAASVTYLMLIFCAQNLNCFSLHCTKDITSPYKQHCPSPGSRCPARAAAFALAFWGPSGDQGMQDVQMPPPSLPANGGSAPPSSSVRVRASPGSHQDA